MKNLKVAHLGALLRFYVWIFAYLYSVDIDIPEYIT